MKDGLINITQRLLKNNNISFDKKEISFQIQSHPSYPSLHAITGVLDHFNIENIAADVSITSETLAQLPDSFLAQILVENGKDLVVVEKNKKSTDYIIHSDNNKKESLSENEFLQKFTGIIVAVENEGNGAVKPAGLKESLLFGILATSLLIVLFYQKPLLTNISHNILSLIGIVISLAILKQENGEETTFGNVFCSGNIEKKDCDAVLTSKGAELFKGHKLSDVSLLYFSGLTLTSLLLVTNFSIIHLISFLAFPITLYSIYYQYAVIKKWCLLCLTIVGVLWIQSAISFFEVESLDLITSYSITTIILSFVTVYIIWNYLKPIFIQQKNLQKDKIAYMKFKRNYILFDSLLQKSPYIHTEINDSNEIVFGNTFSNLEIVVITNPFCGHCRPVHKIVEDLLQKHNDAVKIIIRFNINTDDIDSQQIRITSRLIELFNATSQKQCLQALHEIYNGKAPENWLKKWQNTNDIESSLKVLRTEKEWCTKNNINFTPEILINGTSFPKEYNKEDLLFFIDELEENSHNQSPVPN